MVAKEFGHSGRPLPTWACSRSGNVKFDNDSCGTSLRDISAHVPGCFQLIDVLSPSECDQLVDITERMGYDTDAPVSLPHSFRHMSNVNWIPHKTIVERVWERVVGQLPDFAEQVAPGAGAVGLNARFRCYKYVEGVSPRLVSEGTHLT